MYARRRLKYTGDVRTRPMKDRVREAVFNLVGPSVVGAHAIDLFAGTGALGLEALSRGAAQATFIEQHFPTAAVIRENIATLQVAAGTQVVPANTFIWARRLPDLGSTPWVVFCSPPYDFYVSRAEEIITMLTHLWQAAPAGSTFVVEADERFDFATLPGPADWDVREYRPARVGIQRK
jgi:16S rRNA (guanine966-N2)-methyltransferase